MTFAELQKICSHYHLSLDHLLSLNNKSVLFDAPGMSDEPAGFEDYMRDMVKQFYYFNSFTARKVYYLCKDSSIWNFYLFPEMAAFKTFFWSKTINNDPALAQASFSFNEFPYTECFKLGQEVLKEYNRIPCVELWNLESMQSTINQIAYYKEAGHFKNAAELEGVIRSFHLMIDHLQLQAEKGVKFMPGDKEAAYRAPIEFYVNELILGNNTMVIQLDENSLTMVTYSVLQYLFTRDPRFSAKVMQSFNTLLSRATLISKSGERDRNRFFNALRQKVNGLC